jgi:hypothetical protein
MNLGGFPFVCIDIILALTLARILVAADAYLTKLRGDALDKHLQSGHVIRRVHRRWATPHEQANNRRPRRWAKRPKEATP